MAEELTIMLGGEAGQGLQSIGAVLCRSLSRLGLHVFANQDYESRIRGGLSFFQLRTSNRRLDAHVDDVDILVAFTEETITAHRHQLRDHGVIIYDRDKIKNEYAEDNILGLHLTQISQEKAGSATMGNTVALGAAWSMMNLDTKVVDEVLETVFGHKGEDILEKNITAFREGVKLGEKYRSDKLKLTAPGGEGRYVISCTEGVGLGALASDIRFYSAYPMTPATGVMEFVMKHSKQYKVVVEQAEDEISAINMAIGSSFMGVRSMTGTSGGGFSLMVEALGLAGCVETPLVVMNAMRPGPATGMPTRTEQCDLLFAIWGSHGEFPRVVLAPGTPEEAFELTVEAFNLADRLQTPVILLTDHHLMSSYWTVDGLPTDKVVVDEGKLVSDEELNLGQNYLRYKLTDDGVSPRMVPGRGTSQVCMTGDEHDETGHVTEDPELRVKMVDKRWKKLELIDTQAFKSDIQSGADTVVIGWGVTFGVIREAVEKMRENGEKVSSVHLTRLWPFPSTGLKAITDKHKRVVVVENNGLGQLARLMRMEAGIEASDTLLKYDGRMFSLNDILKYFAK